MEEDAFEVAGEQDDLLDGTVINLYSLSKRRSSSVGDEASVILKTRGDILVKI